MSERRRAVRNGLLFLGGVLLLYPLQRWGDANRPKLPSSLLYTPDRRLMKVIACGHGPTLADLVWLQSTNYVMSEFKTGKTHIDHLYALYDVMTELDPDFVDAYVTGAVFLSSIADEPERSLELLEKGHGRIDERGGAIAQVTSGRIHPKNKDRWKVLGEIAATHMVSLGGFAPTLEERYAEVNTGGRLYTWGAKRYPKAEYPERPDWWEEIGPTLASRQAQRGSRGGWYFAVLTVWNQRIHFTPRSSPLWELYDRRMREIRSRQVYEDLSAGFDRWKASHGGVPPRTLKEFLVKIPDDPLNVGYYVVDGELVAPALDAALLERELGKAASAFRRRNERAPGSLAELLDFERTEKREHPVPRWVIVTWDEKAGEARTRAVPPS